MAKKIVKGAAGILGIGKKKKAAAATPKPVVDGQPIITPLDQLPANSPLRKRTGALKNATVLGYDPSLGTLGQ